MIQELDQPGDPFSDEDTGYGDEAEMGQLSGKSNAALVETALKSIIRRPPSAEVSPGEVSDPDDDTYPDPDDFFGGGNDSHPGGDDEYVA